MVKIIAEIGCNYQGNFDKALEMIEVAASQCKVDIIKFQKRNPKELLSSEEFDAPHPVPENSFGSSYGLHRDYLESNIKDHILFKKHCEKFGKHYSTSVWDLTSAKEVIEIKPNFIKIPSALNLNFELLDYIYDNFFGDIHISLGMTKHEEEDELIKFVGKKQSLDRTVIYSCTSGYPVKDPKDIALLEVTRIKNKYGSKLKGIGFSGHHLGIAIDVAAVTLGAEYIERHFTLDRTLKGTDHAASLEPDGLRKLCRDLNLIENALVTKDNDILDIELTQRKKLKKIKHI